jgi:signal transduction histidine kinase
VPRLLILLSLAGILPMAIVAVVILAAMGRAQPLVDRGPLVALLVLVLLASALFVWLIGRRLGERPDRGKSPEAALEDERRARQAAEAASREKDEFLALLAHELRNPLGAIVNAVRLIERLPAGSPDFKAAREVLGRQTEHLARIVDDLRDAGRARSGRIALRRNLFDLSQAVAGAVAALRHASGHDWQLELRPVLVSADPARMDQVLAGLLGHAAATSAPRSTIRVSLREEAGNALLQVEDAGPAQPEAAESIALTLVRRLVELHGGEASAGPRPDGAGMRFTVRLPAIPEPAPAGVSERRAPPAPRPARQARVLLVEDNDDARAMLQRILQAHGHLVSAARDGRAGLEAAAAGSPNVAVVDIGLPGMDGYQFARAMRERLGQRVRLIAVTGYGTEDHRKRAAEAGFDAHLTKPVDIDRLLGLIAED